MASVNLTGTLTNPEGEPDEGAIVKFTLLTTTGTTVSSSKSQLEVPQDGLYDIDIVYGNLRVDYINEDGTTRFVAIVTVNGDTVATSLPELLNAAVPPTDAQLLEFQGILADAVTAQVAAEAAETGAVAAEATLLAEKLTTVQLIALSNSFAVGSVIDTLGYTSNGDGGGARWVKSGISGSTPSQSPAQKGGAVLSDGSGDVWAMLLSNDFEFDTFAELQASNIGNVYQKVVCRERAGATYVLQPSGYTALAGDATLASGLVAALQLSFSINAAQMGAKLDGVTDDTIAFQNALARAALMNNGVEVFFNGNTITSQTLTMTDNTSLVGSSASRQTGVQGSGRITAIHSDGAVIRVNGENVTLKNLYLRGSAARRSGVKADNYGILIEGDDDADGAVRGFRFDSVYIGNHPNHGILSSGYMFVGTINQCAVRDCGGHGMMFDNGVETGRTFRGRPGGVIIQMPKFFANSGHQLVIGSGDDDYGAYRFEVHNMDSARAGVSLDPAIKFGDAAVYFKGENITTKNCAFNGDNGAGVPTYRAMICNGRVMEHSYNRYIGTVGIAHIEQNPSFNSTNITFDGCQFGSTSTNVVAVTTDAGVDQVKIVAPEDSTFTDWFDTNLSNPVYEASDRISRATQTLDIKKIVVTSDADAGVIISRDSATTGISVARTGTGAVVGGLTTAGGDIRVGSNSDSDVVLIRNDVQVVTVKDGTVNIAGLPTTTGGLAGGDLWNDSGTLKIV